MQAQLNVRLLGRFSMSYGGVLLDNLEAPRLQQLITYLILKRDQPQSRLHLASVFWPDSGQAQALANVRNLVHHLRRALPYGSAYLAADHHSVMFSSQPPLSLDLEIFDRAAAQAARADKAGEYERAIDCLEQAASIYQGDLLPGCYEDWVLGERERLLQIFMNVLERLAGLCELLNDLPRALQYARLLLQCDHLHEPAYCRLMRLYALAGSRIEVMRTYQACTAGLQQDLGLAPSDSTRRLYEHLMQGDQPARQIQRPAAASRSQVPLLGRRRELAQIQQAWRRSTAGEPYLALLAAEAGMGKTRLIQAALRQAAGSRAAPLLAVCQPSSRSVAYAPLRAWLQGEPQPYLDPVWLAQVQRMLPPAIPHLESDPGGLHLALTRMLRADRRPVLLAIDNLQWCDSSTLAWLHSLLRSESGLPVLVLAALRPEQAADNPALPMFLNDLRYLARLIEIPLSYLEPKQVGLMANRLLQDPSFERLDGRWQERKGLQADTLAAILRDAGGNPFFIQELLKEICECIAQGMPVQPQREWKFSERMQALMDGWLDLLSQPAREFAELAAVAGSSAAREHSPLTLLRSAGTVPAAEMVDLLDELCQRRILEEAGSQAYHFRYPVVRQRVVQLLSSARRSLYEQRLQAAQDAFGVADHVV